MGVIENDRLSVVEETVRRHAIVDVEFGITDDADPAGIDAGVVDQAVPDLRPGNQDMIEFRAFGVETDRPIPGAVARVNDLEMVEAISVLEDQRGLSATTRISRDRKKSRLSL